MVDWKEHWEFKSGAPDLILNSGISSPYDLGLRQPYWSLSQLELWFFSKPCWALKHFCKEPYTHPHNLVNNFMEFPDVSAWNLWTFSGHDLKNTAMKLWHKLKGTHFLFYSLIYATNIYFQLHRKSIKMTVGIEHNFFFVLQVLMILKFSKWKQSFSPFPH